MKTNIKIKSNSKVNEIKLVKEIYNLIEKEYNDLFVCVLVHGSVGSNEIIPYSDFDGLLIVKNEFLNSRKLKCFEKESMKLIYQFDPLQHHKWFVITENQLRNYPQNYFPYELFEYSTLIYPDQIAFEIALTENVNYTQPFLNLCQSLENKIKNKFRPRNDYEFKSFLSELMLLPALFLQAKFRKGVYKKDSFILIKNEIDNQQFIEELSKIRSNWVKPKVSFVVIEIVSSNKKYLRKIAQKYLMPKVNLKNNNKSLDEISKKSVTLICELKQLLSNETN